METKVNKQVRMIVFSIDFISKKQIMIIFTNCINLCIVIFKKMVIGSKLLKIMLTVLVKKMPKKHNRPQMKKNRRQQ